MLRYQKIEIKISETKYNKIFSANFCKQFCLVDSRDIRWSNYDIQSILIHSIICKICVEAL